MFMQLISKINKNMLKRIVSMALDCYFLSLLVASLYNMFGSVSAFDLLKYSITAIMAMMVAVLIKRF